MRRTILKVQGSPGRQPHSLLKMARVCRVWQGCSTVLAGGKGEGSGKGEEGRVKEEGKGGRGKE